MWINFILVLAAGLQLATAAERNWKYGDLEQHEDPKWGGLCERGKLQSPINLDTELAFKGQYDEFDFTNYDDELDKSFVKNTGHSVQVDVPAAENMKVSGGGLQGVYILEQIHWHWRAEHTIDRRRYALEAHFVHRYHNYSSISEASKRRKGIAVMSVLYHPSDKQNDALTKILDHLGDFKDRVNSQVDIKEEIKPDEILPADRSKYFRYEGSLTTPTCDEAVVWTIFLETVPISLEQIEQLQSVKDSSGNELKYNFRPLQEEYLRPVVVVGLDDDDDDNSSSKSMALSSFVVLAIAYLVSLF